MSLGVGPVQVPVLFRSISVWEGDRLSVPWLTQCLSRSRNINILGSVHYLFIIAICVQG